MINKTENAHIILIALILCSPLSLSLPHTHSHACKMIATAASAARSSSSANRMLQRIFALSCPTQITSIFVLYVSNQFNISDLRFARWSVLVGFFVGFFSIPVCQKINWRARNFQIHSKLATATKQKTHQVMWDCETCIHEQNTAPRANNNANSDVFYYNDDDLHLRSEWTDDHWHDFFSFWNAFKKSSFLLFSVHEPRIFR